MPDIETIFRNKVELLSKGLFLNKNLIDHYNEQGFEINFGRKGGAGPLGGRYFLFEDNTLVNVALWDDPQQTDLVLGKSKNSFFEIIDLNKRDELSFQKLRLVQNPDFYKPDYKTSEGIPMKKIALVHGVDCLASTIYQKCVYWACGEACKFCGIELSLQSGATIPEKTSDQMNEVIKVAKKEGRCNHMTLTSGTDENDDKGAKRYIEILRGIKSENPNLPLHVQIEPMEDRSYIDKLYEAGADTIGIHLEILDENLRREITPGKAHISYSSFETNWSHALEVFGKDQVESFILTGFGESYENFINKIEDLVSIGVIPFITPVRSIPGKLKLPMTDPNELMKMYLDTANIMKNYGVNPLNHKAGCVKCGGCSAINEAYKVIKTK